MVTPISFALQGTLVLLLQSHMVMAFGKRSELRLRVLDWVLGKAFLAQLIKNLSGFMANCCCLPSSHTSNLEIKNHSKVSVSQMSLGAAMLRPEDGQWFLDHGSLWFHWCVNY